VVKDSLGSLIRSHCVGVDFDIIIAIAVHSLKLGCSKSNLPVASIKFSFNYNFEWASNADSDVAQVTQAYA